MLWLRLFVHSVEDKICTGTEREENKPSTSNKEDNQVTGKGTVPSTTVGNSIPFTSFANL